MNIPISVYLSKDRCVKNQNLVIEMVNLSAIGQSIRSVLININKILIFNQIAVLANSAVLSYLSFSLYTNNWGNV